MSNINELLKTELIDIKWDPFLWYDVPESAKTLEVWTDKDVLSLRDADDANQLYDYIAIIGNVTEKKISLASKVLKPFGAIILAFDNKYGYKYWSRPVEGCITSEELSPEEIETIIQTNQLKRVEIHYPIPDYKLPVEIYSEKRLPKPGNIGYVVPEYQTDRYATISDAEMIDKLCKDGVLDKYAASYIWICRKVVSKDGEKPDILYTKYNSHRAPQYRLMTVITSEDGTKKVYKKTQNPESREQIENICKNYELLKDAYTDIKLLPLTKEDEDTISFDYIEGTSLLDEIDFGHVSVETKESLISQISERIDIVLNTKDDTYANMDPILSNFIRTENGIVCMDYEWVSDNPVSKEYLKYRILTYMYTAKYDDLKDVFTSEQFIKSFGYSDDDIEVYSKMEDDFQCRVHGEGRKYIYTEKYGKRVTTSSEMQQHIEELEELVQNQKKTIEELNAIIAERDSRVDADIDTIQEYRKVISNPIYAGGWWMRKLTHKQPQKVDKHADIRTRDENGDKTWLDSYVSEVTTATGDSDIHTTLSGENPKFCGNIDSITVDEYITIEGWAFISGRKDNNDLNHKIILKNDKNTYIISTAKTYRWDIKYYNPLEPGVDYTGFVCRFKKDQIESGEYEVGVEVNGESYRMVEVSV